MESGLVTEDDMLPMGHCQILPPLCPLQMETAVVGSQQKLPCGSIGIVTTEQEPVVDGFSASPDPIQIPHPHRQGASTYEPILPEHPQQSTVLMRCGIPRSPRGLAWHQSSSGSMPPEVAVNVNTSQTHVTNNSTLLHALKGKGKHLIFNTYMGLTGQALLEQSARIEENYAIVDSNLPQCEGKFGEMAS